MGQRSDFVEQPGSLLGTMLEIVGSHFWDKTIGEFEKVIVSTGVVLGQQALGSQCGISQKNDNLKRQTIID